MSSESEASSIDEHGLKALLVLEDPATSARHLTAVKLKVKATGNPYLLAHLLSHLGHAQGLARQLEQAKETLNEADYVLLEAAQRDPHETPHRHRAWLRYMIERARFFHSVGWTPSALTTSEDAREMARHTGQFDLFKEVMALRKEWGVEEQPVSLQDTL